MFADENEFMSRSSRPANSPQLPRYRLRGMTNIYIDIVQCCRRSKYKKAENGCYAVIGALSKHSMPRVVAADRVAVCNGLPLNVKTADYNRRMHLNLC